MASSNHIKNVAIVGASGNSGKYMTEALLKNGKHNITAITREGSDSKVPDGVNVKKIDYEKPETIVEALKGQDALVITLSGFVPKDTQTKLIEAAGEAGVGWILPNEWSPDTANEGLLNDVFVFQSKRGFDCKPQNKLHVTDVVAAAAERKAIAELGKSSFIAVSTGFWYEWSLSIEPSFGFDLINHKVTLFDEGETKISISTWPQVGRTVAALLGLPIKPEGGNKETCLENFANKLIYANSFTISQKDMLDSVLRVTGTNESDWDITKESSHDRYATGIKEMKEGNQIGFAKMMYTRVFFPDGSGDTEHNKGTVNAVLGLPKDDLDEATARAIERAKTTRVWGQE